MRVVMLLLIGFALLPTSVSAGPTCRQCGCTQPPQVNCRVECRQEPVVTWQHFLQHEPATVQGHSCPCGVAHASEGTAACGCQLKPQWKPTVAPTFPRTQLLKQRVVTMQPSYVAITEIRCPKCGNVHVETAPLAAERSRLVYDPVMDRRELAAAQANAAKNGLPTPAMPNVAPSPGTVPSGTPQPTPTLAPPTPNGISPPSLSAPQANVPPFTPTTPHLAGLPSQLSTPSAVPSMPGYSPPPAAPAQAKNEWWRFFSRK